MDHMDDKLGERQRRRQKPVAPFDSVDAYRTGLGALQSPPPGFVPAGDKTLRVTERSSATLSHFCGEAAKMRAAGGEDPPICHELQKQKARFFRSRLFL